MKNPHQKFHFMLILCMAMAVVSCKNDKNNEPSSEEKTEKKEAVEEHPENQKIAFETEREYEIMYLYMDLKNALVKTDAHAAKKIAEIMTMKLENPEAQEMAKSISKTENVETQRKAFFTLSEKIEKIIIPNLTAGQLYKQYCPMAFDNKGAFWFSREKEIRNPYFGDKMLTCGKVEEIIN